MDKINYTEKILTFNLLVGNQDQDIALKYLSQAGWDETMAAKIYNEESKKMEQQLSKYIKLNERKEKMKPRHINSYPEYKIDSINSILNKITYIFKEDNIKYFNRYYKRIKNAIRLLDDFILQLRINEKTGIIILYSTNQIELIRDQIKNIINEPLSKQLFKDTLIYPVIDISPEGNNFIKELECNKLPIFIICKYKNTETLAVIDKIGIPFNLCDFRDKILESELAYDNNNINNNQKNKNSIKTDNNNFANNLSEENKNNEIDLDNIQGGYIPDYRDYEFEDEEGFDFMNNLQENNKMSDGQVLAIQELKLRELEKNEEQKQKEEEKLLEEEKKNKNILEREIEESKKIKKTIKPEPEDDNPDKCIILFRFPNGENSIQRKFLKQDKINILYDFVKSLGRDIYTENYFHHFSLLQTFPYKLFDDRKGNTLEEEGLFPNSVLQIKEIE